MAYKSTREGLLARIEQFLRENPSTTAEHFGWRAIGDTSLVPRLRNGGDITTRKLDSIIRFIATPNSKEIDNGKQEVHKKEAR